MIGALGIGRMDGYVGRAVVGSYLAGLLFMTLLFVLIDVLLELGDYMDTAQVRGTGTLELLATMGHYYLLLLPIVFVTVAPFVSVIAGMFAISRLMAANEIVPMLFTGRSIVRVLAPILLMGGLSGLAMMGTWEFVLPSLTPPLNDALRALGGKEADQSLDRLVVKSREGPGRTLFLQSYDPVQRRMEGVSLLDRGSSEYDTVLLGAPVATWDDARGDWRLEDGRQRTADRSLPREWLDMSGVTPELLERLGKEGRETIQLSYSELLDLRRLRPLRSDLVMAYHTHFTFPLANLVLLLLALPFAITFERGSRIGRVVFAIGLCGIYLVADLTCQTLGNSMLHPVLAAWLPTIVFGSLGVATFSGVRT